MEQLKYGQEVVFTIKHREYIYQVQYSFLHNINEDNDKIFSVLGLDKREFAYSAYGYEPDYGDWPLSKHADYSALTRIVEALFPYCYEVTVDGNIVYSKFEKTIFRELESSISSSNTESSDIIDFESIVQTTKIKLTFI